MKPFHGTKGKRIRTVAAVTGDCHKANSSLAGHPPAIAHPFSAPTEVPTTKSG
jgi:hypothetical protein